MVTACKKKNNNTGRTKTESQFTSNPQILLFKNFFISLFSALHDIWKTLVFRNNAMASRIYLLLKVISHLIFLYDCNKNI